MNRPLRILMTADAVGGVWTYCMELAAAVEHAGVEMLLTTMGPAPSHAQRAKVGRFAHVRLATSEFKLEWMDEPWSEVDAAGEWLLSRAEEFQPDVVHLNGYVHADLRWDAPVLVVAHSCVLSWWSAVKGEYAPPRFAEYGRRVNRGLRNADLIVAPTRAMLNVLREHYVFDTPARIIPNCRRAELFSAGEKRPIIFSAGRLWDEAKNTVLLERIAPELRWPIHLAGKTSLDSSAILLGELTPDALASELASASIYAAPARYEPFGLGILEAALAGCALVLSDIPSLRENWSDAAIFLSPDEDAAWRDELNRLAQDTPRRLHFAAVARERGLQFNPAQTAIAYLSTWRELASTASRSTSRLEACLS